MLKGKDIVICNLLNKYSIGWGIASVLMDHGARVFYTYQGERSKKDLNKLFDGKAAVDLGTCDVTSDEELATLWARVSDTTASLK